MLKRRDVLKGALGAFAADFLPVRSRAESAPFSREAVVDLARELAKKPFAPPPADLPDAFANLTYERYAAIRLKQGAAIWASENRGFSIEPLHRGQIFSAPVEMFVVDGDRPNRVVYDPAKFDYGPIKPPEKLGDIGFSGFRVLRSIDGAPGDEVALFQGASFFRAAALGQSLGVSARGLSIRTADPHGEEFPAFRSYWIEKPPLGDNTLIINALLDSPSVAGAYRFTLRPGEATIIDTELTLFPRANIDNFGLAGMSGASLFTPLDRRRQDDLRGMAGEVNGMQMLTGKGEWLWRPLSNRKDLQLSAFVDDNPKGFGFLIRNRDIAAYDDDDQHWERRPSLWIEPLGEWGEGAVQLVEIPSESEINANIIAYWRPRAPLVAGKEASFAYRQFWCYEPPTRAPLATAIDARSGRGPSPKLRRFLVVFSGGALGDAAKIANLKASLTTSPGVASNVRTFCAPQSKNCRVVFDLDLAGEAFCEMRLVLRAGDEPLSETWLYRWTP